MRLLSLALAALAAFSSFALPVIDREPWTNNVPLGFCIYECNATGSGIRVAFETDLPPPYLVGVFVGYELSYNGARYFPVCHKVVWEKCAVFEERPFLKKTVFVQVGTTNSMMDVSMARNMTDEEIENYEKGIAEKRFFSWPDDPDPWHEDPKKGVHGELVGDYVWASFAQIQEPNIQIRRRSTDLETILVTNRVQTFVTEDRMFLSNRTTGVVHDLAVLGASTNYLSHLQVPWHKISGESVIDIGGEDLIVSNRIEFTLGDFHDAEETATGTNRIETVGEWVSYGPFDTSVGTGYRVLHFDDGGPDWVCRAYSARTNRSAEVVVRRPVKSLSAHNQKKMGSDWVGQLEFVSETNAVPHRIYPEGL